MLEQRTDNVRIEMPDYPVMEHQGHRSVPHVGSPYPHGQRITHAERIVAGRQAGPARRVDDLQPGAHPAEIRQWPNGRGMDRERNASGPSVAQPGPCRQRRCPAEPSAAIRNFLLSMTPFAVVLATRMIPSTGPATPYLKLLKQYVMGIFRQTTGQNAAIEGPGAALRQGEWNRGSESTTR